MDENTRESLYAEALLRQRGIKRAHDAEEAAGSFEQLGDYKDAAERARQCREKAEQLRLAKEQAALEFQKQQSAHDAQRAQQEDAVRKTDRSNKKKYGILIAIASLLVVAGIVAFFVLNGVVFPANSYQKATDYIAAGDLNSAVPLLVQLKDYKDSADLLEQYLLPQAQAISGRQDAVAATSVNQPWFSINKQGELRFIRARYNQDDTVMVIPDVFNGVLVTGIAKNGFKDCPDITDVVFPKSLLTIGEDAFNGCVGLQSLVIPEGVTALDKDAFKDCTNLKIMQLPVSLESIGATAFKSSAIFRIKYAGSQEQWDAIAIDPDNDELFMVIEDEELLVDYVD